VLEVRYDLHLPSGVEKNREHRRPDTVACRVATRVRLRHGSPVTEVEVTLDNRAKDHRLRVVLPTPIAASVLVSDGQFLINERPIEGAEGIDWVQPPPPTRPQQDFSLLCDGERGLAVFNRGLPEMQAARCQSAAGIALKLTLLRCVGWLSRDDFSTRRQSNAGPMIHTPDAQCLGTHRFRYALMPFAGNYLDAGVVARSLCYRVPVLTKQGVRDRCVPGGRGLLEKREGRVAVSAVKKHHTRDTLIVRLWNASSEEVLETLTTGVRCLGAWRTDLLEERLEELATDGRTVTASLGPHEIATLELALESGEEEKKRGTE
jgi:alpha-mannosidase